MLTPLMQTCILYLARQLQGITNDDDDDGDDDDTDVVMKIV